MIRVEIVANHSVEENILEALARENAGKYYTKIPSVFGVGHSGPRMGDAIWPEENFIIVIWCDEEEARGIARAVAQVKEHFPDEGIKLFGCPGPQERQAPERAEEAVPGTEAAASAGPETAGTEAEENTYG